MADPLPNALTYYVRDITSRGWLCPACRGLVVNEAELRAANSPDAANFLVKQAILRHVCPTPRHTYSGDPCPICLTGCVRRING